jgi:pyruvate carboxylase
MLASILAQQVVPAVSELTSFGAAGMMSAMWLWERYTSRTRDQQLTDAHERVMADRVQLDALVDLVQQNAQAMTRLTSLIERRCDEVVARKEGT